MGGVRLNFRFKDSEFLFPSCLLLTSQTNLTVRALKFNNVNPPASPDRHSWLMEFCLHLLHKNVVLLQSEPGANN